MADINNFSEISENFDTIKTLLNSIRAQGILNTSDVDKLLEGINSKLQKINTEEDVELIKAFLTELKQNLDERHNVVVSKFGAIESLFSNLLKNSTEAVKTGELKELFDIVATNLSVFSKEVVSQKEALSDITLRLDAMRSDESQKKDIIKSVVAVKNDVEKVNNGFDSIVISLNENFKTVLKTISEIDQSEEIKGFANKLNDIVTSSNAVLSAIQLIDKKNIQIEDAFENLSTHEDASKIEKSLFELNAKSKEISDIVESINEKYYKLDNLSDKIDAAVNIIVGLKTEIEDKDSDSKMAVLEKLSEYEHYIKGAANESEFASFRNNIETQLSDLADKSEELRTSLTSAVSEINHIGENVKIFDANINLQKLTSEIKATGEDVKEKVVDESEKLSQLLEVNISRTISDISTNADVLNTRMKDAQTAIASLCDKNFSELEDNITALKEVVSQLDENNVSANNAIFSNITDRLLIFENSLKSSLEKQEDYSSRSAEAVIEQLKSLKNLTENVDYKLDTSSIEISNSKQEFENLKESLNQVLALDFVNVVKDLKTDLYAVKQDLSDTIDNSSNTISDKYTSDLFNKYDLLIKKLDSVEDDIKYAQSESLEGIGAVLNNISSSIVDVLSYVSVNKESNYDAIETKLSDVVESVKDSTLNYVENVRDVVDVVRAQVETNLRQISAESDKRYNNITSAISESNVLIKEDIKKSYEKLLEVNSQFDSIKDVLNVNNVALSTNISDVLSSTQGIKDEFDAKMNLLKNALLEKITEAKSEFTCENADALSELKFNAETMHSKTMKQTLDLKNELKSELDGIIESLRQNISSLNENVADTALKIEGANKEIVGFVKNDLTDEVNNAIDSIKTNTSEVLAGIDYKVGEVVDGFSKLDSTVSRMSQENTASLSATLAKMLENFNALHTLLRTLNEDALDKTLKVTDGMSRDFNLLRGDFEENKETIDRHLQHQNSVIADNYSALENLINSLDAQSKEEFRIAVDELNIEFNVLKRKFADMDSAIDKDLAHQVSIIEGQFESLNMMLVDIMNQATDSLGDKIKKELNGVSTQMSQALAEELEQYKAQIEDVFQEYANKNDDQSQYIKEKVVELNEILEDTLSRQNHEFSVQIGVLSSDLNSVLSQNIELTSADYSSLKQKLEDFQNSISENNNQMVNSVKAQLDDIVRYVNSNVDVQAQDINTKLEELASNLQGINISISDLNKDSEIKYSSMQEVIFAAKNETFEKAGKISSKLSELGQVFEKNVRESIDDIKEKMQSLFEEHSMNFVAQIGNTNSKLSEELNAGILELKSEFETLNERLSNDELTRINVYQSQIKEMSETFNGLIESAKELTKQEVASVAEVLVKTNKSGMKEIEQSMEQKINSLLATSAEISAGELQSIESFVNQILSQVESVKQNSIVCKDLISNLLKEHLDIVTKNIEKETDVIVGDLLEQISILKDSQKDDLSNLTNAVEGSVAGYIIDAVNDLKSYLDVKTENSVINGKLDALRSELEKSYEDTTENINKLLEASVFTDSITDLRATNEVLVSSMADKLNLQIQNFVKENVSKKIDEKLNLFDKKFAELIVDKYEEIRLFSEQHKKYFDTVAGSVESILSELSSTKDDVNTNIMSLIGNVNKSLDSLNQSFEALKSQLLNKSFDEAFHESVHNQIVGIEDLVKEQIGYIEDISDLCCTNLPELTELNTIVKYGIQQSLTELKEKVETQEINVPQELNKLKTDIITQILNVFNQISFVAEQDEIIEFIQEKHSELITILSHIVTTSDGIETVKDNLAVVDNKVDSLKEDIDLINEKITAIMSSSGDIDYVYSLQDLESDIANLRLVLNEMKNESKSKELEDLVNSTNNIYQLVETIKAELPKFEAEEFKKDFENLSDDIVSISTRTNKLLLASDESYKTLQENLQDFKLVINDLDERTRNFSHEAGIDKIDNKLAAINAMMQNGAKTNQVFNQVFEYLAEWVDKAGNQITAISDKVETLDDIGQIKVMLEDLRAESQDNSESEELVNTLGEVFDKQAKRIASLEAKLDRMIVDNTINNRQNQINMTPLEDTLNRFLVAIDDKMSNQQAKINSLEKKLEEFVSLVDNKDTAQLTKKVGGMDRQLAKLNKSIEKIASNVVEK